MRRQKFSKNIDKGGGIGYNRKTKPPEFSVFIRKPGRGMAALAPPEKNSGASPEEVLF